MFLCITNSDGDTLLSVSPEYPEVEPDVMEGYYTGMKYAVIGVVSFLMLLLLVGLIANNNHTPQSCGKVGVRQVTGSITDDSLTVICNDGRIVTP